MHKSKRSVSDSVNRDSFFSYKMACGIFTGKVNPAKENFCLFEHALSMTLIQETLHIAYI